MSEGFRKCHYYSCVGANATRRFFFIIIFVCVCIKDQPAANARFNNCTKNTYRNEIHTRSRNQRNGGGASWGSMEIRLHFAFDATRRRSEML